MRLQIGEIVAKVLAAESAEAKIAILREYNLPVVRDLVKISKGIDTFVALPDSAPPYTPSTIPYPYNDSKLYTAWKMFPVFRSPVIKRPVAEMRFIQLLEGLHAQEAEFLLKAHLKELDFGLTDEELNSALSGLNLPLPTFEPPPPPEPVVAPVVEPVVETPRVSTPSGLSISNGTMNAGIPVTQVVEPIVESPERAVFTIDEQSAVETPVVPVKKERKKRVMKPKAPKPENGETA